MPEFVIARMKHWDGTQLLSVGTRIRIKPENYAKQLCREFDPAPGDKEAFEAIKKIRTYKDPATGQMREYAPYTPKSGDLDPNDRDDLKQLLPEPLEIVSDPK